MPDKEVEPVAPVQVNQQKRMLQKQFHQRVP